MTTDQRALLATIDRLAWEPRNSQFICQLCGAIKSTEGEIRKPHGAECVLGKPVSEPQDNKHVAFLRDFAKQLQHYETEVGLSAAADEMERLYGVLYEVKRRGLDDCLCGVIVEETLRLPLRRGAEPT